MKDISANTGWRESWPQVVVRTDTETAVRHLQAYYAVDEDGQPRYTGSQFEVMAAMNPDLNALGPGDFVAVSILSVDVPPQAAIRLLHRDAPVVQQLLHQIPVDMDIVDADPQLLGSDSPAGQLWNVLRKGRDGLGPTTTSKLLASKRPRLLPIWDSFVERATGLRTLDYWRKVQFVLAAEDRAIWNWLGELRSRATNVPESISELRILDILLWMSVEGPAGRT